MLAPLKVLTEPANSTSAFVAVGPSTALWGPVPLATWPALLLMENSALVLASAPQTCASDAVPHSDWLGRWKVSLARVVPGGGGGAGTPYAWRLPLCVPMYTAPLAMDGPP